MRASATCPKLRLGISACLLGECVRYDGGHKYDAVVVAAFAPFVEWVPVCPEAEAGLGVPREPMCLVGDPARPRLVTVNTGVDHAKRVEAWAQQRATELAAAGLDGFILKSRSPSCGLLDVPVRDDDGTVTGCGRGLFAAALLRQMPGLSVEEADRLHDARLRESFLEQARARRRR